LLIGKKKVNSGFLKRIFPPNIESLTTKGDIEGLIDALSHQNGMSETSRKAAESLATIGTPAVEPLVAVLTGSKELVRGCAAWTLGKIGDNRAVEPLIAALRDHNEHVRELAASALGKIGDDRAVEPLIAALKDSNEIVRANAATALGWLHDDRAVEPLTAVLSDPSKLVQEKVTVALYRLHRPDERPKRNDSRARAT
jgi:HEAT repeat protein